MARCRRCGQPCEGGHCDPCKAFRREDQRRRYQQRAVRRLERDCALLNARQQGYRLGYAWGYAEGQRAAERRMR